MGVTGPIHDFTTATHGDTAKTVGPSQVKHTTQQDTGRAASSFAWAALRIACSYLVGTGLQGGGRSCKVGLHGYTVTVALGVCKVVLQGCKVVVQVAI